MMQRFKGNRGIKAAFPQIAGKIVCAKQGEPFSRVLAGKPLQHVRREVHSRHRQIGKASKDGVQLQPCAAAQIQKRANAGRKQPGHPAVVSFPTSHMDFIVIHARVKKSIHALQWLVVGDLPPLFPFLERCVHASRLRIQRRKAGLHFRAALAEGGDGRGGGVEGVELLHHPHRGQPLAVLVAAAYKARGFGKSEGTVQGRLPSLVEVITATTCLNPCRARQGRSA